MCIAIEIVTMKLAVGIEKEKFNSIVDGLEKDFHFKQSGFFDMEIVK